MSERNRWRHKERGTTYRELGRVTLQCSFSPPIGDGYEMVLYQGEADGRYWCRPPGEFHDGRFEQLPDAAKTARLALAHIRSMAGHPDPAEACRLIIKRAQRALDALEGEG